jgi:CheY-like chemotaxis protein
VIGYQNVVRRLRNLLERLFGRSNSIDLKTIKSQDFDKRISKIDLVFDYQDLFFGYVHKRLPQKLRLRLCLIFYKVFKHRADTYDMVQITEYFPSSTRILVVEDDSDLRLTLCEYLESRHYTVSSARNGTEAANMLQSKKHAFDIIFTDLMMPPGPDGLEVLKVAKQVNPHSYVVVMTGYSSIETAIESIRCGAFDYLTKPFKLAQIEIVADRIVEHLCLLDDNRKLSRKVSALTDRLATIDSRLERIELILGRLAATPFEITKG